MPKPAYIICAQSGAHDAFTQSDSCFEIIDSFDLTKLPEPITLKTGDQPPIDSKPFRVVACWLKSESDDSESEFEAEFLFRFSDGQEIVFATFKNIKFAGPILSQRLIIPKATFPGATRLGYAQIECRIRKVGTTDWIDRNSVGLIMKEKPQETKSEAKQEKGTA